MLSFKLNDELAHQLSILNNAFAEAYAEIAQYSPEIRAALHRYAKIRAIGASTRIENAVLTDAEIDWIDTILSQDGKSTAFLAHKQLIENKLKKDKERSIEEVAGCREMLELIYQEGKGMQPLSQTLMGGLHKELLKYYPKAHFHWGKYKIQSNSVVETNHATRERRVVFETAPAGPVTEAAMRDLTGWYNQNLYQERWSIALACEFVYRFLAIHPFQDGNGRLSRGLFLLVLLQSPEKIIAGVVPYLAIDRHIERRRSEYYGVLNRCSHGKFQQNPSGYHIEYFLQFMIKVLQQSLADIEIYKRRFEDYQLLSASAQGLLECFKEQPEMRLSNKQLFEKTGLPKRTIAHLLGILTKKHFIQKYGQGAGVRYQLIF